MDDDASPGLLEDLWAFPAELHGYFERRADALPDLLHLACSVLCVGFLSRAKGF